MKFFEAEEYQDRVNAIYEELSEKLIRVLPNARVEHIGSSAITGAVSKGDLDVFVGVDQNYFEKSLNIIKKLGFVEKEDTLRTQSLCMLVTDEFNHDVAVQLVANKSEFEDFLRFKERIQSKPELVSEYNELKRTSVKLNDDEYRDKKSKWVVQVLSKVRK